MIVRAEFLEPGNGSNEGRWPKVHRLKTLTLFNQMLRATLEVPQEMYYGVMESCQASYEKNFVPRGWCLVLQRTAVNGLLLSRQERLANSFAQNGSCAGGG